MKDSRDYAGLNLRSPSAEAHERAESLIFGFWIFLMADLVLFAVLFAVYATQSVHGIADGPAPSDLFGLGMPLAQTLVLLASSFTIGLAMLRVKYDDDPRGVFLWLGLTAALGLGFLGLEGYDFVHLAREGHTPQTSGFLSIYWLLTGTHWLHVACGLLWAGVLSVQTALRGMDHTVKLRLMRLGLYWHMLDVVWVGIFSFVFLFGVVS